MNTFGSYQYPGELGGPYGNRQTAQPQLGVAPQSFQPAPISIYNTSYGQPQQEQGYGGQINDVLGQAQQGYKAGSNLRGLGEGVYDYFSTPSTTALPESTTISGYASPLGSTNVGAVQAAEQGVLGGSSAASGLSSVGTGATTGATTGAAGASASSGLGAGLSGGALGGTVGSVGLGVGISTVGDLIELNKGGNATLGDNINVGTNSASLGFSGALTGVIGDILGGKYQLG